LSHAEARFEDDRTVSGTTVEKKTEVNVTGPTGLDPFASHERTK
jgi:hypothetical protein